MKDAEYDETNEKSIFRFLVFEIPMVIFIFKICQFFHEF